MHAKLPKSANARIWDDMPRTDALMSCNVFFLFKYKILPGYSAIRLGYRMDKASPDRKERIAVGKDIG